MSTPNPKHLKTDSCPHQLFAKTKRSVQMRRNAPPPIPIPVKPVSSTFQVSTTTRSPQTLSWVTIELSNYPPQLTRRDVYCLFRDFTISPNFTLPNTTRLMYPLRTFLKVAGKQEAERAASDVSGTVIGGRQVLVKVMEGVDWEQSEIVVAELVIELKIGIITHVHHPHLASKILEVRERAEGASYFAFLQARDPVTVHSTPEAHKAATENKAKWELISAGCSDANSSRRKEDNGRLSALKNLQQMVESQGILEKVWSQWEGSWMLNT